MSLPKVLQWHHVIRRRSQLEYSNHEQSLMDQDIAKPQAPIILVGICGGIAAYKAVEVVSGLRQRGYHVHVAMSEAACRFVTPLTFAAVSGNRVLTEAFPDAGQAVGESAYPHLYPATQADYFLLIPATANTMARIAHGEGQEIVSMTALSLPAACRRIFCPSMNVEMWEQSSTQANVRTLEERGWLRIGPETGALACGMTGAGRLTEPADILMRIDTLRAQANSLAGQQVLILSGPTREYLDPVRYIGNSSSGKMGQALAEEAADRGARVTFVTGPVASAQRPRRPSIQIVNVTSAQDMLNTASDAFEQADAVIFAAAVADYQPAQKSPEKLEKEAGEWALPLIPTPDIAATLASRKRPGQMLIGFALQSGDGRAAARAKLERKQLDAIVLNHPDAMGADHNSCTWIAATGEETAWGTLDKRACASRIWEHITES